MRQRQPSWGRRYSWVEKKEGLVARHKVGHFMFGMEVVDSILYHSFSKFLMRGSTCTCRYQGTSSERHRPTSLIMLVAAPEQRRSMSPAAYRYCADIYLGVKPRLGPIKRTVYFSVMLISAGVVLTQRPHLLKVARFLEWVAPCSLRYRTW